MDKIKLALYALITTAILVSVNYYISSSQMYINKTEKIDRNFKELDLSNSGSNSSKAHILVIGNSYVEASFDPDDEDGEISFFRVAGMPLADMLGIIEHLPEESALNTILVGLGYNYATPEGSLSSVYDVHFTKNPVRKIWAAIPLVRGRSNSTTILKEDIKCLISHSAPAPCDETEEATSESESNRDVLTAGARNDKHLARIRRSTHTRYTEYVPFTSQLDANFERYLRRMVKACKERNIRLYAYTAPIYSDLRNKLPEDVLDQFRKTIVSTGIDYMDLNEVFPQWNAEMFSDATHVDKASAGKIITDLLLEFANMKVPPPKTESTE